MRLADRGRVRRGRSEGEKGSSAEETAWPAAAPKCPGGQVALGRLVLSRSGVSEQRGFGQVTLLPFFSRINLRTSAVSPKCNGKR